MTEDEPKFDQDDVVEYLENDYFHKDDPDLDEVLDFASDDEDTPTEETLDRYREYVDRCVEWAQYRMSLSDEFHDMLFGAIECSKWADDYDMFTASIRDFLDAQGADKEFSRIKTELINQRVASSDQPTRKGLTVVHQNIPLDSHIIADTDYLRQYIETCPDIVLDELNDKRLIDANDTLFDKIVDRIIDKAIEDDRLHDELAETIHDSWLWEYLSNMCDDIAVDFMREATRETLKEMKLQ